MFTESTMNTAFNKVIGALSPRAVRALVANPSLQAIVQAADRAHVDERQALVDRIAAAPRRLKPDAERASKAYAAAIAKRKAAQVELDHARDIEGDAARHAVAVGQAVEVEVADCEAALRRSADPRIGRVIVALNKLHSEVGQSAEFGQP